jgi:hypothetical protein
VQFTLRADIERRTVDRRTISDHDARVSMRLDIGFANVRGSVLEDLCPRIDDPTRLLQGAHAEPYPG